jgi:hypothetical protein
MKCVGATICDGQDLFTTSGPLLLCRKEWYRYKALSHYTRKSLRGYIMEEKVSEFLGTVF